MKRAKMWLDVHGSDLHRYGLPDAKPRGLDGWHVACAMRAAAFCRLVVLGRCTATTSEDEEKAERQLRRHREQRYRQHDA